MIKNSDKRNGYCAVFEGISPKMQIGEQHNSELYEKANSVSDNNISLEYSGNNAVWD